MRSGLFIISAIVGLCVAVPALAQDVDVRIGHRDHDRGFGRVHGESRTVLSVATTIAIVDGIAVGIMIGVCTAR